MACIRFLRLFFRWQFHRQHKATYRPTQSPHKRQPSGRAVITCDSNSAGTLGQVFLSRQIILNEQRQQGNAAQRGRDACGTATRISASLSRRLSAFFESTLDQDPKAAKFAVLTPGHAGFPNRAKRSEGRDSAPRPKRPYFAVCALVCDPSSKAECVSTFGSESKRGPFVREVENRDERWSEIELLLTVGVHREPGNVCI